MCQKTTFSVSENECSDQGIPQPNGPPSSDCPVGWRTDDAPWRHRVRTPARTDDGDFPTSARVGIAPSGAKMVQVMCSLSLVCQVLPGEAGFETGPCPKPGCESACFPQGFFPPPKTRHWVFRHPKKPVFIENRGIACPHSRRGFFRPEKHAPGFFGCQKAPFLAPGTRRPLPGGAHIKTDPPMCLKCFFSDL